MWSRCISVGSSGSKASPMGEGSGGLRFLTATIRCVTSDGRFFGAAGLRTVACAEDLLEPTDSAWVCLACCAFSRFASWQFSASTLAISLYVLPVDAFLRSTRRAGPTASAGAWKVVYPCAGVEFPAKVDGLFRPHYVAWSEQNKIECHPDRH